MYKANKYTGKLMSNKKYADISKSISLNLEKNEGRKGKLDAHKQNPARVPEPSHT